MAINFSTNDRWIRSSSATNFQQNGATSRTTPVTTQSVGFYNGTTEHIRFDDYGIVTNIFGAPGIVLRKTEGGATPNQNPVPTTLTNGGLPSYDVRGNIGSRGGQNSFLVPVTGHYRITHANLQSPNSVVSVLINGGQWYNGTHCVGLGLGYVTQACEYIRPLSAGDHVQIYSWNGGNVWGDNGWTTLTVTFLC